MTFLYYAVMLLLEVCSGESDTEEQFRPCPKLDPSCIRTFFAQHSSCQAAYGLFQDVFDIAELTLPFPHANCTLIWRNARVTGLGDGEVVELFVNKTSSHVVLEVEFSEVTTYSPTATLRYHRRGTGALDLTDYLGIKYKKFSLTAIIPFDSINGIKFIENQVYGYFGDTRFPIIIGKGLINSDHEINAAFSTLADEMPLSAQEASVVVAPYYFTLYFNNNVCTILD